MVGDIGEEVAQNKSMHKTACSSLQSGGRVKVIAMTDCIVRTIYKVRRISSHEASHHISTIARKTYNMTHRRSFGCSTTASTS